MGLKGVLLDGRLNWDISAFNMHMDNLVVSQPVNNLPSLVNAGSENFKGAELEFEYRLNGDFSLFGHHAYHDARFDKYAQLFGNVLTSLDGKRLEMSPQHISGMGLVYAPDSGWRGSLVANWTGNRYLNKRNTAPAEAYTTVDASIGYRFADSELRLIGRNLTDRRDPVAESELGDAQYYRLPARDLRLEWRFEL